MMPCVRKLPPPPCAQAKDRLAVLEARAAQADEEWRARFAAADAQYHASFMRLAALPEARAAAQAMAALPAAPAAPCVRCGVEPPAGEAHMRCLSCPSLLQFCSKYCYHEAGREGGHEGGCQGSKRDYVMAKAAHIAAAQMVAAAAADAAAGVAPAPPPAPADG